MPENKDSLADDLLACLTHPTGSGDRRAVYFAVVDRLAEECPTAQFYILQIDLLYIESKDNESYCVYPSFNADSAYDLNRDNVYKRTASLKKSAFLQQLSSDASGQIALSEDEYLFNKLCNEKGDRGNSTAELRGIAVRERGINIGFLIALLDKNNPPEENLWNNAVNACGLALAREFDVCREGKRIHDTILHIASGLGTMSSELQLSAGDVLDNVLESTRDILQAQKCALFLVDKSRRNLVLERAVGQIDFRRIRDIATYDISDYDPDKKGTGVTPWVLHRKKPFNARNFDELRNNSEGHWKGNWDQLMYGGSEKAGSDFECAYMVPLLMGEQAIGVLKYENREGGLSYFGEEDERVINVVAQVVTTLVTSQRVERYRYDNALPDISGALIGFFGQPTFYEKLLERCREILDAEMCSLFLVNDRGDLALKAIVGISDEKKEELQGFKYSGYKHSKGLTPLILQDERSLNVRTYRDLKERSQGRHVGKWDKIVYDDVPQDKFRSLYSVPLMIGDEPVGVFKVENKAVLPFYFTESDERLFDLIARLIAIGVKYDNEQYFGRMLRAADLGFLAAGIAHEFGNELMRLSVIANNMKAERPDKQVDELLDTIWNADKRITSFTEIRGRKDEVTRFNIKELANQLVDFSSERFRNHDIDLEFVFDGEEEVEMNSSTLQTILINLLNNAFDAVASCERDRNRKIEMFINNPRNDNLEMRIQDSGPGIPEEIINNIFAPFFTTKSPRGMGIGLYWVQRVVNTNGGRIDVESPNEYNGATFSVSFPKPLK
jgi:signal transduction histidine kinase